MSKYGQDFIEVTPQVFCGDIVNELKDYKSDVFLTYESILRMDLHKKAIITTRKLGCHFSTTAKNIPTHNFQIVSHYTVERTNQYISVSKVSYEQAIAFLKII